MIVRNVYSPTVFYVLNVLCKRKVQYKIYKKKKEDYWHYLEHDANNERFLFTWNKLFNSFHEKLWMYFNFKTQESRQVTHLQYTSWPDHGTPSPLELLEFYRYVSKAMEQHSEQKIIVHCRFDFAYFFLQCPCYGINHGLIVIYMNSLWIYYPTC